MKRKFVSDFNEFVNENLGQDDEPIEGDEVRGFEEEPMSADEPVEDDNLEGELGSESGFDKPISTDNIPQTANPFGIDEILRVIDMLESDASDEEIMPELEKLKDNAAANSKILIAKPELIRNLAAALESRPQLVQYMKDQSGSHSEEDQNID